MFFSFLYKLLPSRKKDVFLRDFYEGGALPHVDDQRDYKSPVTGAPILPLSFSLRGNGLTRVENQGYYNSCVAHAITTCMETFARNNDWPLNVEYSRMHVWNEGRKASGTYPDNNGIYIRDGWKVIKDPSIGMTIEKLFPYTLPDFNTEIGLAAKIFRHWYPKFNYYWINGSVTEKETVIKNVLVVHQVPIVFGIPLGSSFMSPDPSLIYKPSENETEKFYHAMIVTGYDDSRNAFEIMNSWNDTWGDKGFLWVDKNWVLTKGYSLSYPLLGGSNAN
jgi:hypothetical protein